MWSNLGGPDVGGWLSFYTSTYKVTADVSGWGRATNSFVG